MPLLVVAGIDNVTAGGTINVAPGDYSEQLTIAKALTLQGAGQGQTILHAPGTIAYTPTIDDTT